MWVAGLALFACRAPAAPPPPPAAAASHVQAPASAVEGLQSERERMAGPLAASGEAMQPCYLDALARDPDLHGDLILRYTLDADGGVAAVETDFTTLRDAAMESCALAVAAALRFPPPSRPGLTLRYPYVFTSPRTPPEVTRALLLRHGLIEAEPLATDLMNPEEEAPPPVGTIRTW